MDGRPGSTLCIEHTIIVGCVALLCLYYTQVYVCIQPQHQVNEKSRILYTYKKCLECYDSIMSFFSHLSSNKANNSRALYRVEIEWPKGAEHSSITKKFWCLLWPKMYKIYKWFVKLCVYMYQHSERRHIYFAFSDIWDTVCVLWTGLCTKKALIR